MKDNFNINDMKRIIKKKCNTPLRVIKAIISDKTSYEKLINDGNILLGYTSLKVSPWNFSNQTNQCFKCQKFGHNSLNCSNETKCLKCIGNHHFKECKLTENDPLVCANCKGNHAACSKLCPHSNSSISKVSTSKNDTFTRNHSNQTTHKENTFLIDFFQTGFNNLIRSILNLIIDMLQNLNDYQAAVHPDDKDFSENIIINQVKNLFGESFSNEIKNKLINDSESYDQEIHSNYSQNDQ